MTPFILQDVENSWVALNAVGPSLTSVATPQFNTEGREGNFVEKKEKEGEARGRNLTLDYILSR